MPPPIRVVLASYDPAWPDTAIQLAGGLDVLGENLVKVEHIGSTSVPGLVAKPIIDLMALVEDLAKLDAQRPLVEALGYEWHGELGIRFRRYCTLTDEAGARRAQLHFFLMNSSHATRHIAFREYLRTHPKIAEAYAEEKRRAGRAHPEDSHAYADEKAAWIEENEERAVNWFLTEQTRL
jgi:GrpB-like predicted nucleotidyltransferase (UPF0157 family)